MFRTVRELGVAVREKLTTLGLIQAEAARQAGVSREWVISLERGKQAQCPARPGLRPVGRVSWPGPGLVRHSRGPFWVRYC